MQKRVEFVDLQGLQWYYLVVLLLLGYDYYYGINQQKGSIVDCNISTNELVMPMKLGKRLDGVILGPSLA